VVMRATWLHFRRRTLSLPATPQVVGVEADVVAEAVVGDASGAGLGEQPGVGDAEQLACCLCVDQPCERARMVVGSPSRGKRTPRYNPPTGRLDQLQLIWMSFCQVPCTGCPRLGGHPGRSRGRRAWLVRDARSG
jgi:hypothetical protein